MIVLLRTSSFGILSSHFIRRIVLRDFRWNAFRVLISLSNTVQFSDEYNGLKQQFRRLSLVFKAISWGFQIIWYKFRKAWLAPLIRWLISDFSLLFYYTNFWSIWLLVIAFHWWILDMSCFQWTLSLFWIHWLWVKNCWLLSQTGQLVVGVSANNTASSANMKPRTLQVSTLVLAFKFRRFIMSVSFLKFSLTPPIFSTDILKNSLHIKAKETWKWRSLLMAPLWDFTREGTTGRQCFNSHISQKYKTHEELVIGKEEIKKTQCDVCNITYKTRSRYTQH